MTREKLKEEVIDIILDLEPEAWDDYGATVHAFIYKRDVDKAVEKIMALFATQLTTGEL